MSDLGPRDRTPPAGAQGDFELRSTGSDGLLGTTDDVIISLDSITAAASSWTISFPPLAGGLYGLTVRDSTVELNGSPLNGDQDGTAGGTTIFWWPVLTAFLTAEGTQSTCCLLRLACPCPCRWGGDYPARDLQLYRNSALGGAVVVDHVRGPTDASRRTSMSVFRGFS